MSCPNSNRIRVMIGNRNALDHPAVGSHTFRSSVPAELGCDAICNGVWAEDGRV